MTPRHNQRQGQQKPSATHTNSPHAPHVFLTKHTALTSRHASGVTRASPASLACSLHTRSGVIASPDSRLKLPAAAVGAGIRADSARARRCFTPAYRSPSRISRMTPPTLPQLSDEPQHFAACCLALSKPLLQTLLATLPRSPALVLSVGCGSGLLEALLLHASSGDVDLYGVEVASCECPFLPDERVLSVPGTRALVADAVLASVLMFVYPRVPALVAEYIDACAGAALEKLAWLGHRSDWADCERFVVGSFADVQIVEDVGLPDHEIMVVATGPKARGSRA